MKKSIAILLTALSIAPAMSARAVWTMQGKEYTVDTTFHAKIGPGTTQTSLSMSGAQSLRVFYTTTDLTDPNVDIRVVKAGNKFNSCMTPDAQARQADREGARYFAGVNADFFANSAPCGSTVVDGVVYNTTSNNWVNWYMTADRKPHIGTLGYQGTCTFANGSTHVINGINGTRGENGLNIYDTHHNGTTTGTNKYGCEVTIERVSGDDVTFTGKGTYRVTGDPVWGVGSMAIPEGGYVLSGHGTSSTTTYAGNMIQNLKKGDIITLDFYPGLAGQGKIMQMASGQPAILSGGKVLDTQSTLDHLTALNPRTAVGYNADGTKLVLLVVDGRTAASVGVVSKVLAEIMLNVGCTEAMNFDGGGSSALYTSAFGYRNSPSDGTPRAVTNTVWCVSTSPDDHQVAELAFTAPSVQLPRYGKYKPQLYAYNQYGVLISTNFSGATLSCDPELGTVSADGLTLNVGGQGTGTYVLTATYNGITATVPVTVSAAAPKMRLGETGVIVDSYRDYEAEVTAAVGNLEMPLDNNALQWTSADASIATVDAAGRVHGVANGTTTVTATVDGFSGTLPVTVQIPATRYFSIVPDENTTYTKVNLTDITAQADGQGGFNVNYTVKTVRAPKGTISFKQDMLSLPDSVAIVFNPGDAVVKSVAIQLTSNGERTTQTVTENFPNNTYSTVAFPISDFTAADDFASYPIQLTSVAFGVGDAVNTPRTIHVKSLHGVHTAVSAGAGVDDITADTPVADGPVSYYDLQGRLIDGSTLAPGLYIRRQGTQATKVLVK